MNKVLLDDMLIKLGGLIEIPSLLDKAEKGAPFGQQNARALQYMLDLGKQFGFSVKNVDGYAGHIEWGKGEQILGILCHLDVVPSGEGWDFPPYALTNKDGVLYGRGVVDNKGSAISCLYALKQLKDEGFEPTKTIRLILGCNEENGSECIKYYKTKEQKPHLAFVPDSDFPLINSEKCILRLNIFTPLDAAFDGIALSGGLRLNMVPEGAALVVQNSNPFVQKIREAALNNPALTLSQGQGELVIRAKGKSCHAKDPLEGINAISILISLLHGIEGLLKPHSALAQTCTIFKEQWLAKSLAAYNECPLSGDVTVNLGMCATLKNELNLQLDCRLPLTQPHNKMLEIVRTALDKSRVEILQLVPQLYVEQSSPLVQSLLEVYAKFSANKNPKPLHTGGGTYARELDNAVAFGPTFENQITNIHEPNEHLTIDEFVKMFEIYKAAICSLAGK